MAKIQLTEKQVKTEERHRKDLQKEIITKFGENTLKAKYMELCNKCTGFCNGRGLPLELDGKNCCYFKEKEVPVAIGSNKEPITLLELQKDFQQTYFPEVLDITQRDKWTEHFVMAIHCELTELLDGINWKTWKKTKVSHNLPYIYKELIDIHHFLNTLYLIWGMNDALVEKTYREKNLENRQRQQNGY